MCRSVCYTVNKGVNYSISESFNSTDLFKHTDSFMDAITVLQ